MIRVSSITDPARPVAGATFEDVELELGLGVELDPEAPAAELEEGEEELLEPPADDVLEELEAVEEELEEPAVAEEPGMSVEDELNGSGTEGGALGIEKGMEELEALEVEGLGVRRTGG